MSVISDSASPSTADSAPESPQLCILVVEDNADMREFLQRILKRRGYSYLEAVDGAEGVALALAERPDLILMDLALPVLDGYEATRLLKTNPDLAATPIVAVTAHARAIDREHAMEAGCDAYISKPYSIHELYALIDRFLPAAS
ncbi:MAG: response regulator [Anaerolineae bacterium]|mgnify:CR=1 FL=1